MADKIRVGVLFGGRSAEHEVSLRSAESVLDAIDQDRFEIVPIGVTKAGRWVTLPTPRLSVEQPVSDADGAPVALLPMPDNTAAAVPSLLALDPAAPQASPPLDVIFPLIHGTYGEDGTVQGLFELAGIPYVGSGVLGSAAAMDKAIMKALLLQAGLPTADYRQVMRQRWQTEPDAVRLACERAFGYPMFIKPANLGSSVGVHKVRDAQGFNAAMNDAAQYDRKLLVEQAIENAHEVEVAVLGNDHPQASVPGEIIPCNEFYDYNAKYIDNDSELVIPAPLPDAVTERLQDCAIQAFKALDCAGLARIDFLVRRDDHALFVLEANTLPGFTSISMYPKLWQATGLSYPALITRLIELALERCADRRQNRTSYD